MSAGWINANLDLAAVAHLVNGLQRGKSSVYRLSFDASLKYVPLLIDLIGGSPVIEYLGFHQLRVKTHGPLRVPTTPILSLN